MESNREGIEHRAAWFLQRRESGEWSEADQAELAAWLAASTGHRVAFLRAEAAWEEMGRLRALGAGLPRRRVPTPDELNKAHPGCIPDGGQQATARPSKRTTQTIAIAASLLLSAVAVAAYSFLFSAERYATPVGGIASVPLSDGSQITLNTSSKVRVLFGEAERHVDLARGEAFFEVARDTGRPFVVQIGSLRVVAVGTRFSVRRDASDVQVVVTEGTVRIEPPSRSGASRPVLLQAGSIARAHEADIVVESGTLPRAEESVSWRSGYVVFHETPLAEAVAEFNRYNSRRIVIQDPAVGAIELTGKFRATNHEAFVNLLEQTFHIQAQRGPHEVVLRAARP